MDWYLDTTGRGIIDKQRNEGYKQETYFEAEHSLQNTSSMSMIIYRYTNMSNYDYWKNCRLFINVQLAE